MNAETFNSRYPVGTPVFAYPGGRPEDFPSDRRLVTRTRSKAQVLGGHTDVVWVDGHSACIALSHVDVVSEDEWEAAKTAAGSGSSDSEVDADTVAARAAQVISSMGAELRAARAERDRYRLAWKSASFRAEARGEGIERIVKDRESYQGWLRQAEENYAAYRSGAEAAKQMLTNRLNAVLDLCDREERNAMRWENPIPVPDWVAPVQRAALGDDKRTEATS